MKHTIWACPVTHQQSDGDWPFCSCCEPRQANVSIPVVLKEVADPVFERLERLAQRVSALGYDDTYPELDAYREAVGA